MSKTPVQVTIYHNPRCSKSRETLALLRQHGVEPTVIEYLKTPPNASELRSLLRALGMKPAALVRTGEELYKTEFKERTLSDAEWIDTLAEHPILIERPIVVCGGKAVLGRPPEKVLGLL